VEVQEDSEMRWPPKPVTEEESFYYADPRDRGKGDKYYVPTFQEVVRYILKDNCPDCFHPECMERIDIVEALRKVEGR
jgi:hypothetical protein